MEDAAEFLFGDGIVDAIVGAEDCVKPLVELEIAHIVLVKVDVHVVRFCFFSCDVQHAGGSVHPGHFIAFCGEEDGECAGAACHIEDTVWFVVVFLEKCFEITRPAGVVDVFHHSIVGVGEFFVRWRELHRVIQPFL